MLGMNPSLDLDEPTLKEIAQLTGGQYFRARDGDQLEKIRQTLDALEPVAQQQTQARPAHALYQWPLALAMLFSILLVVHERWPNNPLHRLLNRQRFIRDAQHWRQRVQRLGRRR
jgi:Ca-activated chloride channel family protein